MEAGQPGSRPIETTQCVAQYFIPYLQTMLSLLAFLLVAPPLVSAGNSVCPFGNYEASTVSLGCFSDNNQSRTLVGPEFVLGQANSPQTCSDLCGSVGYTYSGLEYSSLVFLRAWLRGI